MIIAGQLVDGQGWRSGIDQHGDGFFDANSILVGHFNRQLVIAVFQARKRSGAKVKAPLAIGSDGSGVTFAVERQRDSCACGNASGQAAQ
ncbi:hypothetical protein D3C73_508930 [compost metagenome]